MKLIKLQIKNYRSIKDIILDSLNYERDSTTIFVGVNEAGKSNLLKAINLLDAGYEDFNYSNDCNIESKKQDQDIEIIGTFNFSNEQKEIKELLSDTSAKYAVKDIITDYSFLNSVIKTVKIDKDNKQNVFYNFAKSIKFADTFTPETKEVEQKAITNKIVNFLFDKKIDVVFWESDEDKYLISAPVNLNVFADKLENVPLKNMFRLLGKTTKDEIARLINNAKTDVSERETLEEDLGDKTTEYIKSVWKEQNTSIKVRIEPQINPATPNNINLMCNIFVIDKGEKNKRKNFYMKQRSDGYKKFMSLILSLSCENKTGKLHDKIIIIDEPEIHLHPSGCKDLLVELIKLGETNNVFLSTHSIFMIDKDRSERHWIVEKNPKSERIPLNLTYCSQIGKEKSIFDDEVVCKAFGMSIFNDMLPGNQFLVEGASDKNIIEFLIKKLNPAFSFLVRPCGGSKIPVYAALLKQEKIPTIIILDDDKKGKEYKTEILNDDWYKNKVFTLKDLNNQVKIGATIEDLLPIDFIKAFMSGYNTINENQEDVVLDATKPVVEQFTTKYKDKIKLLNADLRSGSVMSKFKVDLANKFIEENKDKTINELNGIIPELLIVVNALLNNPNQDE